MCTSLLFGVVEIKDSGLSSGDYWLQPNGTIAFETYCDMDTEMVEVGRESIGNKPLNH